jgi:hypothetical protein
LIADMRHGALKLLVGLVALSIGPGCFKDSGLASGGATGDATAPVDPTTSSASSSTGDATTGPACGIGRCKDIDLVFIVDDSPSMGQKAASMIAAVLAFDEHVRPGLREACSVHFGVTTTSKYAQNPAGCQTLGALVRADNDGEPCSFVEGLPYATLADFDDPPALQCMLSVGSAGDTNERPIDALFALLDPAMNDGCNAGFYRKDAFFAAVIVTDEDDDQNDAQGHDGSEKYSPDLWYDLFTALKATGVDDMYMTALLGDEDQTNSACPWMPLAGDDGLGAEAAPNLRGFVRSFPDDHHAIDTLCKTSDPAVYEAVMLEIKAEIAAACAL